MVTFFQVTHRRADEALADSGITSFQFYLLRHIENSSPVIQLRLASNMGVTPGAISQQIVKLEGLGLLIRESEGKKKILRLTDEGRAVVARLEAGYAAFMASVFASISSAEQESLLFILRKLNRVST